MEHLDFVNNISELGISLRSTNTENKVKEILIDNNLFGKPDIISIKNFNLTIKSESYLQYKTPLQLLITKAIDMDSWKNSWHKEIAEENYDDFKDIIQRKIIDRAKQIDELMTIYFQLQHEMSNKDQ